MTTDYSMVGRPWCSLLRFGFLNNLCLAANTWLQVKEFIEDPRKMLLGMG